MANNPISADDLIKSDVVDSFKKLDNELTEVIAHLKEIVKEGRNVMSSLTFKSGADVDKFAKSVKAADVALAQAVKTEIVQAKLRQENIKIIQQQEKLTQQQAKTKEQEAKATAKQTKEQEKLNSSYQRAAKQLNDVKKQLKDLSIEGKSGSVEANRLRGEFIRLDKAVRVAEEGVGEYNRSVGSYKKAIGEALQDTGLFNNGIGRLIGSMRELVKAQEGAGGSAKKFSNILKGGVVLLALAAIAAAKELLELNQAFVDGAAIFAAKSKDFALGGTAFETAERGAQAFRITLRKLQADLQKAALDEQDFNEIAADTTIGFQQREQALKKAIEQSQIRASKEVEIAQGELARIKEEITAREAVVGTGRATNDLLDKRSELERNLADALDKQGNLVRQNAERERKQNADRAIAEIELLRSKKLSANAEATILEKQLSDEKVQIEERIKIRQKLQAVNNNITAQEIAIFKRRIGVEFDTNELLKEQDAVRLKSRLEAIRTLEGNGLGEEATNELAKVIKEFQTNQIANNDIIIKQNDELLDRKKKIAQIEREISIIQIEDQVKDTEKLIEREAEAVDKLNEKILKDSNVFSTKLEKQREFAIAKEESDIIDLFGRKKSLLEAQADNERKAAEETIKDNLLRTETIKKIDKKLEIDLDNLSIEQQDKEKEVRDKTLEDDKKFHEQRIKLAGEFGNKIVDNLEKVQQRQQEKINNALDKEIESRQSAITRQQELADRGLDNTLAFEKQKLAEAELAKEKERRKEISRQKEIAFLRLLAGYAQSDPGNALKKALFDIALATAIQGTFAKGVENFQGEGTGTSDENIVAISHGESVATARGTKDNPGLVTAMNKGRVSDYFENIYLPKYLTVGNTGSFAGNVAESAQLNQLVSINDRILSLETTIKNKPVYIPVIDKHGNNGLKEIENGIERTLMYVNRKPRI